MAMKIEDLLKQINQLQNETLHTEQALQESQIGHQGSTNAYVQADRVSSFGLSDSASQF